MRTHCSVTSVHSNKISSLVQSPVEMKASFCDETDKAELDIDVLMLPASQHYEGTLLTLSRPNVGTNLPAPSSTVQLSVAPPVSRPRLSSIPLIPTCRYHAPLATSNGNHVYSHTWKISFPAVEISLRGVEISDLFSTRYTM